LKKESVLSAVDLLPTFCELAKIELPGGYEPDGESFASIFENIPFERTKPLFWDWHFAHVSNDPDHANKWPENAVRDGAWKLYHNAEIDRVELYNLQDDPFEKHNVSERNMDKVAELLELLSEWKAGLPD
jgi:arylsulfatase A-like enzyme